MTYVTGAGLYRINLSTRPTNKTALLRAWTEVHGAAAACCAMLHRQRLQAQLGSTSIKNEIMLNDFSHLQLGFQFVFGRPLAQRLSHPEVGHDFLAAAVDGRDFVHAVEALHLLPHARAGDRPAAEDLAPVVCEQGAHAGGLVLEQPDLAREVIPGLPGFRVAHHPVVVHLHLVGDVVHVALQ